MELILYNANKKGWCRKVKYIPTDMGRHLLSIHFDQPMVLCTVKLPKPCLLN